jgi:hypothetical protein
LSELMIDSFFHFCCCKCSPSLVKQETGVTSSLPLNTIQVRDCWGDGNVSDGLFHFTDGIPKEGAVLVLEFLKHNSTLRKLEMSGIFFAFFDELAHCLSFC